MEDEGAMNPRCGGLPHPAFAASENGCDTHRDCCACQGSPHNKLSLLKLNLLEPLKSELQGSTGSRWLG
jgi:hypothetical protein